jgi:hypothetical protein
MLERGDDCRSEASMGSMSAVAVLHTGYSRLTASRPRPGVESQRQLPPNTCRGEHELERTKSGHCD